jgi:hypothetical protein
LGALSSWLVLGHNVAIIAILGALVCAPIHLTHCTIPIVVVHSHPSSRGETCPYRRDD